MNGTYMQHTQATSPEIQPSVPTMIFIAILVFASLSHITADMYVPSLPYITKALSSDASTIQLSLSIFMLGYSVGHLFYGPISDRIGRRSPILFGMGLSVFGTLLCFLAPTTWVLIVGRLFQGLGVAACNSVGRSLLRDLVSGSHLAKIGSNLGMVMVFVVATAPTLGGYIQSYFGWRAVFLVLLVYTAFCWLLVWKTLPETNLYSNRDATKIKVVLRNYALLLTNKTFMGYSFAVGAAYGGLIAYVTCAPFLFQTVLGLTPAQYGWLAFINGISIFVSFFINSRYVMKKGVNKMLRLGNFFMLTSAILMLMFAMFGWMNVWVIMFPISLYCIGAGLTFSNGFAGAFQPFPQMAGSVGALFGCLQILGAAIASAIMAGLHVSNQVPLGMMLLCLAVISWASLTKLVKEG